MKGLENAMDLCVLSVVGLGHDALTSVVLNLPTADIALVDGMSIERIVENNDRGMGNSDGPGGRRAILLAGTISQDVLSPPTSSVLSSTNTRHFLS